MLHFNKKDILSFMGEGKRVFINRQQLSQMDITKNKDRKSLAYYIVGLSQQLKSREYKNLVQFFLLSLSDIKKDQNSNIIAFSYSKQYLTPNVDDDYALKVMKSLTDDKVADFFSHIVVKYNYAPEISEALEIKGADSLGQLSKMILGEIKKPTTFDKISDSLIENISPLASDTMDNVKGFMKDWLPIKEVFKPDTLENLLEGINAVDYYKSLMPDNKPTPESIEFFYRVTKEWTNFNKSKDLKDKLNQTLSFIKEKVQSTPQNDLYVEDLFSKHIPNVIGYIQTIKKSGDFSKQLELIITYSDKINNIYMDTISHKMRVYQKFLEEKISNIN